MRSRLLLAALLFVASAGTIQKYAGTAAALVSLPLFILVAAVLLPWLERLAARVDERQALVAACVALTCLALVFIVVYPHANSHALGQGSDRDDAADLGARRLLDGRYLYGPLTYLRNPISQLPGELALAAPFVAVLGHSGYANVLALALLAGLLVFTGRRLASALVIELVIVLSPGVLREYVTGGDLIANTVYVAAASVAVYALATRRWAGVIAAAALGVTLASRGNFAFVLIPLAFMLAREGIRRAGLLLSITVMVAATLAAIAVARPAGRTSIRIADHLDVLGRYGSSVTIVVAVAVAVVLALRTRDWAYRTLFTQAAIVQAIFPLALVLNARSFTPLVSGYGVPAVVLSTLAVADSVVSAPRRSRVSSGW